MLEARGSGVQSHPYLHRRAKASLGFMSPCLETKSETKEKRRRKVYFASVSDRAQFHCYKLADQNRVTMEEHRESCLSQGAQTEGNRADLGHDIHPHWPTSSYQVLPLVPHHLPIILSGYDSLVGKSIY